MPPKRTASSTKRKASPSESGDESAADVAPATKRGKTGSKSKTAAKSKSKAASQNREATETREGFSLNGQPNNKMIPERVEFPEKHPGSLRISSWNVSGLAAAMKKGFSIYVKAEDADMLILTETKMNEEPQIPALNDRYPYRYWSIASKKGYSGTAIFSKIEPKSVIKTIPGHPDAEHVKGRIVTLEFEKFYLIGTYVTNAGNGLKTLPKKEEWNKHFTKYIRELDEKKPVIWAGDLNVAPSEKDLTHAKKNWNKSAGYTESEVTAFARILDPSKEESDEAGKNSKSKFLDIWRDLHPDDHHYSYFGYRFDCRSKGIGWRLDMFVLSERLRDNVKMCEIRSEIYGASDHCPIMLEIGNLDC